MKVLGRRLQELRARNAMSQGQVAEYAGVAQSSYSELERGIIQPKTVDAIVNLVRFFGVSADYLLGLTDDPTPPGRGEEPPPFAVEMSDILRRLGPVGRERLLAVAQTLLRHEEERHVLAQQRGPVLYALADRYGPEQAADLEQFVVEAVAAGLSDATILGLLRLGNTGDAPQD